MTVEPPSRALPVAEYQQAQANYFFKVAQASKGRRYKIAATLYGLSNLLMSDNLHSDEKFLLQVYTDDLNRLLLAK